MIFFTKKNPKAPKIKSKISDSLLYLGFPIPTVGRIKLKTDIVIVVI